MTNNILIEVCCGGINDCLTAIKGGCDRIELNSALEMGGLTPSVSVLKEVKKISDVPVCCMVRPRGNGFCYSQEEFEIMKKDAQLLLENGADGIVFGFLNPDCTVNEQWTREMVQLIHPKQAIFHKAFDDTPDLLDACKTLIDCGIDRILTSGGASYPEVMEGFPILKQLISQYGSQIQILPGGGVRKHNVVDIIHSTGCNQIHMTAKHMAKDPTGDPDGYVAVDADNLRDIMNEIKKA